MNQNLSVHQACLVIRSVIIQESRDNNEYTKSRCSRNEKFSSAACSLEEESVLNMFADDLQ